MKQMEMESNKEKNQFELDKLDKIKEAKDAENELQKELNAMNAKNNENITNINNQHEENTNEMNNKHESNMKQLETEEKRIMKELNLREKIIDQMDKIKDSDSLDALLKLAGVSNDNNSDKNKKKKTIIIKISKILINLILNKITNITHNMFLISHSLHTTIIIICIIKFNKLQDFNLMAQIINIIIINKIIHI